MDPDCVKRAADINNGDRDKAIVITDTAITDITRAIHSAVGSYNDLGNTGEQVRQAQTKMPAFKVALTKERDIAAPLGPSIAACGHPSRDGQLYAFMALLLILAILLFALEITGRKGQS